MRIATTPATAGDGWEGAPSRRRSLVAVLAAFGLLGALALSGASTSTGGPLDGRDAISASQALLAPAGVVAGRQALSKAAAQDSPASLLALPATAASSLLVVLLAARRAVRSRAEQACVRATPSRGPPVRS